MADGATSEPGSEEPAPAPVLVVPSLSLSSPPPLPLPLPPLNRQPAAAETLSPPHPHGSKSMDRIGSLDNAGGDSEVATDAAPTPPPKRRRRKRRTRAKIATPPTVPRYQLKLPPGLLTSSSSSSTSSSSSSSPASASSERKEHLNGADHEKVKQTDMDKKKGKDTKKDKRKKKKKKDKRKKDKKKKGGDDDEAPVCRVCRMEASAEAGELYAPCLCAGSMQFVHQACLTRWLQVTHRDYCELCKHRFAFKAVYAEDAPRVLGPIEFAGGVVRESASALGLGFRLLLVGLAWLLVFPLGTFRFLVLVAGSDPVGMFVDLDPLTVLRDATFGAGPLRPGCCRWGFGVGGVDLKGGGLKGHLVCFFFSLSSSLEPPPPVYSHLPFYARTHSPFPPPALCFLTPSHPRLPVGHSDLLGHIWRLHGSDVAPRLYRVQ